MKLKIGIFDSGIGGFTILGTLMKTRKDIEVFYLADTKRVPYGNKNIGQIRYIAKDICNFEFDLVLNSKIPLEFNSQAASALDDFAGEILEFKSKKIDKQRKSLLKKNFGII